MPREILTGTGTIQPEDERIQAQEAALLTGQDYSLAHQEQMIQDAFSQTSQVTNSMWEQFAKNRGIKTLGRSYSRNSFVNLLMLSEGYPFDSLFSTDPLMAKTRAYYGKRLMISCHRARGTRSWKKFLERPGRT